LGERFPLTTKLASLAGAKGAAGAARREAAAAAARGFEVCSLVITPLGGRGGERLRGAE